MVNVKEMWLQIFWQMWVFIIMNMSPQAHLPSGVCSFLCPHPHVVELVKMCVWKAYSESGLVLFNLAWNLNIWDCSWCGAIMMYTVPGLTLAGKTDSAKHFRLG